jgi:hypothetical protein
MLALNPAHLLKNILTGVLIICLLSAIAASALEFANYLSIAYLPTNLFNSVGGIHL